MQSILHDLIKIATKSFHLETEGSTTPCVIKEEAIKTIKNYWNR